MPSFSDFFAKVGPADVFTGQFLCQECDLPCFKAEYDRKNGVLRWRCDKNHTSEIKYLL